MTERRAKVPAYLRGPFQSEYDRLNIDPTPPGVDTRTQKPVSQNAPIRVFHGEASRPTSRRGRHSVATEDVQQSFPVQTRKPVSSQRQEWERMPVQVGNHEDQMWFDDESIGTGRKAPEEYIDNNDEVDVEALQNKTPFAEASRPVVNENTTTDDASRWVKAHQEAESVKNQDEPEQFSLDNVSPGELLVLYNNQVIYRGANEQTARQAVESILLQFQPSTEDIVVLKRVAVDFGVSFI